MVFTAPGGYLFASPLHVFYDFGMSIQILAIICAGINFILQPALAAPYKPTRPLTAFPFILFKLNISCTFTAFFGTENHQCLPRHGIQPTIICMFISSAQGADNDALNIKLFKFLQMMLIS